ncbi:AraC family transcriptional regulator [Lachnospiraceae bacterium 54-53]
MIQKFIHQYYQPNFSSGHKPKLQSVSFVPSNFNKKHPRILHQHTDAFEMLFIISGEGYYYLDSAYYKIKCGDLIFCNSGVLHDELPEKNNGISFYGLRLSGFTFHNLPDNHLIPEEIHPIVCSGVRYDMIKDLFEILFQYGDAEHHMEEFCEHIMMAIMNLSISLVYGEEIKRKDEKNRSKPNETRQIYQIKQYIDQNYHDDLSLESLGKTFYLSPYYLSHIFKSTFQIPPMQYLYRRRIGEAQSLLIATREPITRIAGSVGFGDPNYFAIQFKKYVGMTPSAYRTIYAKSISD